MMQVDHHVRMRLISRLLGGISRILQKFLKYFNGTTISKFFVLPSAGEIPVIFALDLYDSGSVKVSFGSSL